MAAGYSPNEKNLKMFGVENSGYTRERVDGYLFQLETAYVKMKEKFETFRAETEKAQSDQDYDAQEAKCGELEEQLANALERLRGVEEQNKKLRGFEEQVKNLRVTKDQTKKISEMEEQNRKLREAAETVRGTNTFLSQQVEELTEQLEQAKDLAVAAPVMPSIDEQRDLIAKVLIDARSAADEIIHNATAEAEKLTRDVKRRQEMMRSQYEQARNQLQGLNYAIGNLLRESEYESVLGSRNVRSSAFPEIAE